MRDETLEIRSLNNARAAARPQGQGGGPGLQAQRRHPRGVMLLRAAKQKPTGNGWFSMERPDQASSAISSISTQAPMGIWAIAEGAAGDHAFVAKHLAQQLAGAVGHQVLLGGSRRPEFTRLITLTMRLTRLRSPPVAACSVPSRSMATARAISLISFGGDVLPNCAAQGLPSCGDVAGAGTPGCPFSVYGA